MRLELLAIGLLAVAGYLSSPIIGRRECVGLVLAVLLGIVLSLGESLVALSAGLPADVLYGMYSGGTRALTTALVHTAVSRLYLLPFTPPPDPSSTAGPRLLPATNVRTLKRRPLGAGMCLALLAGGVHLLIATEHAPLGAVLVAVAPFLATFAYVGARMAPPDLLTLVLVTPTLLIASFFSRNAPLVSFTRAGLTTRVPGIPISVVARDAYSALSIALLMHLVAHVHVLLLVSPTLPPSPPDNIVAHATLLAKVLASPPGVDTRVLSALSSAPALPPHLCLASLAAPRELRIVETSIAWWYASISSLARTGSLEDRRRALRALRLYLIQSYEQESALERALTLCTVPLEAWQQVPFYLFTALVPRLVPIFPFLEICQALMTIDAHFIPVHQLLQADSLDSHLPISSTGHLEAYTNSVGGALATTSCYAAWSVLEPSSHPLEPTRSYVWSQAVHPDAQIAPPPGLAPTAPVRTILRANTIHEARIMGRGMHLVSIASNAGQDSTNGRVYLPLSAFKEPIELLQLLRGKGAPLHVYMPVLRMAEQAREDAENSIDGLPRSARAAARAAVAAAYVPACCLWGGAGASGKKSCTCNRTRAVLQAIWRS